MVSISKITFICIDDSLCSEYDDKGSSSHIKSQRQQLQPRSRLVLNNVNAQKLEASPPYYHPKAFHLYLHMLGRNIEVSSCNNYLALVIMRKAVNYLDHLLAVPVGSLFNIWQQILLSTKVALKGDTLKKQRLSLFLKSTSMITIILWSYFWDIQHAFSLCTKFGLQKIG